MPNVYDVKFNPIRDIALNVKKNAGKRWLTEEESKIIWNAPGLSHNARYYFRLNLALAGQRIQEVYHANISEFNFEDRIFTIPKERVKIKSRGDHVVPLSDLAIEILNELKPHIGPTGLLFPQRWRLYKPAHYNGLLYPFHEACKAHNIPRFATQDIRRTCKTLMSKAGVPTEHRDMLQQHHKNDVASVHYDRYDYLREKRNAILSWEEYLISAIIST